MIRSLDQGVGRIISVLNKLNLRENTLIIFFSDNGPHGAISGADPLRGSKGMLYEGGIRVPLIISWSGMIREGTICDIPVIGTDFFPTILEIVGAFDSYDHVLDGQSIRTLLEGRKRWNRESIYWHFPAYLERYNGMDQKFRLTPAGAIRKGDWKLIEFFEDGKLELYNLSDDISESNDLSKSNPKKTQELHNELLKWRAEVNAPVPTELNPGYNSHKVLKDSSEVK
jgi:arylsulfatase A-like enzyme